MDGWKALALALLVATAACEKPNLHNTEGGYRPAAAAADSAATR